MCFLFDKCERCNHTNFFLSMYKIKCGHYVCKSCVKIGVKRCKVCDKSYYVSRKHSNGSYNVI